MNFFSKNLRYLRKRGRLSQAELAGKVDKRQNTIGNWENQVSEPSMDELNILAQFFKVNMQDFINRNLEEMEALHDPSPDNPQPSTSPDYLMNESPATMAREDGQDQFWVLVRELRRINKKLDYVIGKFDTRPVKPPHNSSSL